MPKTAKVYFKERCIMDDDDKSLLKGLLDASLTIAIIVMICAFVLDKINIDYHIDSKKAESILDSPMLFLAGLSDGSDFMAGFLPRMILESGTKYTTKEVDKMIHDKGRWSCFNETGYNLKCFASMDCFLCYPWGGCKLYLFRSIHSHITYYVEFDKGIINWLFYIAGWAVAIIASLFVAYSFLAIPASLLNVKLDGGDFVIRKDGEWLIVYYIRSICFYALFLSMFILLVLFSPAILLAFYIFIILGIIGFIYYLFNERSKDGGD